MLSFPITANKSVRADMVGAGSVTPSTGTSFTLTNSSSLSTVTATFKAIPADTYVITVGNCGNSNYTYTVGTSGSFSIVRKVITLSWAYSSGTTGSFTYNAGNQGVILTVSGIEAGDIVKLTPTITGSLTVQDLNSNTIVANTTYRFLAKNYFMDYKVSISTTVGGDDGGNYSIETVSREKAGQSQEKP